MASRTHLTCMLLIILIMLAVGLGNSDMDKDREECGNQLVGLATCLPYVGGDAKAPTLDCCSGLKQVLKTSKQCLCILVKDRNDPSLGLKINATLALSLPSSCHAPSNISECPSLLHLAPHSPDAKVFEDFVNNAKRSNSTLATHGNSSSSGSSAAIKSEGGKVKSWLGVEMVYYIIISMLVHLLPNM